MKVRFVKPEASNPERDRGITVPYAPGKRHLARWRWYLILLVVSSPFLFFVGKFLYSSVLIQAPGFVAQEQLTVRSSSQGHVDQVYVKPLDEVREGQPVAQLSNEALSTHADQLRAELKQLQGVALTAESSGRGSAALDSVDFAGELDTARSQKQRMGERLQQMQQLLGEGAATEGEVNAARNQYDQASSRLDELYRTMALQTRPPPRSSGSSVAVQTRILNIQTELNDLDSQLQAMVVRAPKSGRIVDLAVVSGDQLAIGSKVAMLAPTGGEMHVDAYIPPKHAIYAVPGVRATVIFPDGVRRRALVSDVPQVAAAVPKTQSALLGESDMGVLVRMQLLDGGADQPQLTDGLPVRVEFENGWNGGATRQLVVQIQHYWSYLMDHLLQSGRA